jgi:hypothetical protein
LTRTAASARIHRDRNAVVDGEAGMRTIRVACLITSVMLAGFAQAGPITAGHTRIENEYPEQIAFSVDVSSGAALARVELHVAIRGDTSTSVIVADFAPGTTTTARAVWKTKEDGVPPGAAYDFRWEIRDEAGASLTTPSESGLVMDLRYDWSALMDDQVAVWWYEGDTDFGQRVFELASGSLSILRRESGFDLPEQLHVVLYPDFEAFADWHEYVQDWVGGEAYPAYSLTVQIVSPSDPWEWVQAVICHEVAHLYFYRATYHPISSGPSTWIEEGYAQIHECVDNTPLAHSVEAAVRQGELIPLRLVTGTFTGDDDRIRLLYAESWSAVTFLYSRWGAEGMSRLMEAFRDGADSHDALRAATGLGFEEFQQAWWEWLGGEPGAYPTPPAPVTPGVIPLPTATPTPVPKSEATAERTAGTIPADGIAWPCAGGAAAAVLGSTALLPRARSKPPSRSAPGSGRVDGRAGVASTTER